MHVCWERAPWQTSCIDFDQESETCGCVCNVSRHVAGLPDAKIGLGGGGGGGGACVRET